MCIQSEQDLVGLREAGEVVRLTLDALEQHTQPGITTKELDQIALAMFRAKRATSAPKTVYGFPANVLISINDEVVHGVPGPRRVSRGDIVKLDVTVEKNGYMSDAARSVVMVGAPDVASRLKACAEAAFLRALTVARAGRLIRDIGKVIELEVESRGFAVIRELTGHGIGRSIHEPPEVPNYCNTSQSETLEPGLVLTIEPIICSGSPRVRTTSDGWTIRTVDGGLSAHHEHTMLITEGPPVLLTA